MDLAAINILLLIIATFEDILLEEGMILQMPIGIYIKGIDAYSNTILSAPISDWLVAIVFVVFWWILGYIVGGIIPRHINQCSDKSD